MALIGALNILLGLNAADVSKGAKTSRRELDGIGHRAQHAAHAVEALRGALELVGVGVGAYEAVEFFKSSYEAFHEAEIQQRKLESVLEATGHAAGFTADSLREINSALQRQTNFDDDAVAGGEAVLATFREISGVNFERAIGSMLDMSTVLDQDLKSSALQLGKALNDPVRGITALRRAGVSFTEEQQSQIKAMVAAGDVVSAQTVILDELQHEFGGAARAVRSEVTGLANDWGDLKETIGSLGDSKGARDIIEGIAHAVRGLNEALQEFGENGATYEGYWKLFTGLVDKTADVLLHPTTFGSGWRPEPEMLDAERDYRIQHDPEFARRHARDAKHVPGGLAAAAGEAGDEEAEATSTAAAVEKLIQKLKEEEALQGLTGYARELAALKLKGETDESLAGARALAEANDARRRAAQDALALQKEIDSLTQKLSLEARTLGLGADQAKLFELRLRGATEAQLASARAALAQAEAVRGQQRAVEDLSDRQSKMAQDARSVWESTRTPLEKYEAQMARLQQLTSAGELDPETYARAKRKAREEQPEAAEQYDRQQANQRAYTAASERLESLRKIGAISSSAYDEHRAQLKKSHQQGHGAAQVRAAIELRRRYEKYLNKLSQQEAAGTISHGTFRARLKNAAGNYEAQRARLNGQATASPRSRAARLRSAVNYRAQRARLNGQAAAAPGSGAAPGQNAGARATGNAALERGTAAAFHAAFGGKDSSAVTLKSILAESRQQKVDTQRMRQIQEKNQTQIATFG